MKDENKISGHTVKKFDLIEKYVNSWIQKLMNNPYCKEVAFIDCMCNSGIYEFDGNRIEGTPSSCCKDYRERHAEVSK